MFPKFKMAAVRHIEFVGETIGPPTKAHSLCVPPVKDRRDRLSSFQVLRIWNFGVQAWKSYSLPQNFSVLGVWPPKFRGTSFRLPKSTNCHETNNKSNFVPRFYHTDRWCFDSCYNFLNTQLRPPILRPILYMLLRYSRLGLLAYRPYYCCVSAWCGAVSDIIVYYTCRTWCWCNFELIMYRSYVRIV